MRHLCGLIFHFEKSKTVFKSSMQSFPEKILAKITNRKATVWTTYCLLAFCLFLIGCAQVVSPTGGPRDEQPPQLDTLNSTRNYQTRFEKQTIVLAFDEWVELREAFTQVIVSPPLEFRPEVVRRKKTIQFSFHEDEILRDSATYVINFGEAIRDITEGNIAPVTYVFSTGDYIDSLEVSGKILDAFTNEPVKDVLFLLYENLADSVFRTERPFYFGRTDEGGNFEVKNMKSGTFKGTAIIDGNLNYLFDSDSEKIAFLDEPIVVKGVEKEEVDSMVVDSLNIVFDSLQVDSVNIDSLGSSDSLNMSVTPRVSLRLFEPERRLFLITEDQEKYGLIKFIFNRKTFGEETITFDSIGQVVFLENEKDTVRLWYSAAEETAWNVYVQADTLLDTIEVKTNLFPEFIENEKLRTAEEAPRNLPVQVPGEPFEVQFNHPLFSFDTSLIRVYEDSLRIPVATEIAIDSSDVRSLSFGYDWKPDLKYEFEFFPGSLADIYGLGLVDTLRRALVAGAPDEYGTLTLRVKKLQPETAYVIRLLEKNENEYRSFMVAGIPQFEEKLTLMPPGVYSVELIEDLDQNGRWTTGDYDLKRQPERIRRYTLEELRANWEVDSEIEWQDELPDTTLPTGGPTGGPPSSVLPGGNRPGGGRGNR